MMFYYHIWVRDDYDADKREVEGIVTGLSHGDAIEKLTERYYQLVNILSFYELMNPLEDLDMEGMFE